MAREKAKKTAAENSLVLTAKEFLQYFPQEASGLVAADGTPFMEREKIQAVNYCESHNLLLWEYTVAGEKMELVITNKYNE
jgi:hypothetical protein